MSASDIRVSMTIVPQVGSGQFDPYTISPTLGYRSTLERETFATLSSNNPNNHRNIDGLLYTPTLDDGYSNLCADALEILPDNAVNLSSLPLDQNFPLVAIFPWTASSACTEAYILQARMDAARGAFTFQPNTGNTLSPNLSWRLSGDRGNYVIRWNPYPIYAITDRVGRELLRQSALYSGDMSEAPDGPQLVEAYGPDNYPRLFAQVRLQNTGRIPFMWVTIIITLSVLLAVCIAAAIGAHFLRRRQRRRLRGRLERGEVDLQALGIKKLNVPQTEINSMPKYVYVDAERSQSPDSDQKSGLHKVQTASFSQSMCPVCLDDFQPNISEVRELPCRHIFHPECIDLFLRDRSSLCPLCKTSALPKGYCPEITDIMVRRERLARRLRQAQLRNGTNNANATATPAPSGDVELGLTSAAGQPQPTEVAPVVPSIPQEIAAQGHEARATWRREQLARQQEEQYTHQAEATRQADVGRPLWRRVMGRVVPGTD